MIYRPRKKCIKMEIKNRPSCSMSLVSFIETVSLICDEIADSISSPSKQSSFRLCESRIEELDARISQSKGGCKNLLGSIMLNWRILFPLIFLTTFLSLAQYTSKKNFGDEGFPNFRTLFTWPQTSCVAQDDW